MRHLSNRALSRPIRNVKHFGWFRSIGDTTVQYVLFAQCQQTGNVFSIRRVFADTAGRAEIALSIRYAIKELKGALVLVERPDYLH